MENNKEIAVQTQTPIVEIEKTTKWVIDRREKIKEIMRKVMKRDIDYGIIPGCPKPSLLKPGAEKICSVFMLSPVIKVEEIGERPEKAYRIVVDLVHQNTGAVVASGVGEASSDEEKYKWRNAVCQEEYDNTDADKKRIKYKRDGSQLKQVRTEPADIANTVLKMAKKRALIDATLTATGASDIFTQDMEDKEEIEPEKAEVETTPMPQPKNNEQLSWAGSLKTYSAPKEDGKPYKFTTDEGIEFTTFDNAIAEKMIIYGKEKKQILVKYHTVVKGRWSNNMVDEVICVSQPEE